MKPVHRMDSTSQSCSCTSCLYKSESDRPSIKKYIKHGSGIDRLYYGKYIPLRERKLLNKLIRTRAVYDDLRARLISESTLSLEKNANLTPGKHHRVIKTPDSKQSGAVLELVDIIDKGGALESKELSECCSCCSCSSKSKVLELGKKEHRRKRVYSQTHESEPLMGEGVYARAYERNDGKTVSERIGERYNKRGVRFKPKQIRSDPCTCTLKLSGLIKKHSKIQQDMVEKPKKQNYARKSYQKYMRLQDKLQRDVRKLNESRTNLTRKLQVRTKNSLERIKQKSIQAIKSLHPKEYPETIFKIKKDSIAKFKDYLKRKNKMMDMACDLGCQPDICVPDDCFKIIKLRRLNKHNRQHQDVKIGKTQVSKSNSSVQANRFPISTSKQKPMLRVKRHIHSKDETLNLKTSRSSQVSGLRLHAPKHSKKKMYQRHNKSHIASKSSASQGTPENLRTQKQQVKIKSSECQCEKLISNVKTITSTKTLSNLNKKSIVGTMDRNMSKEFEQNRRTSQEFKQNRRISQVSLTPARHGTLTPRINERNSYRKQAVRIGSTFSLNVEFYKTNDQNDLKPSAIKEIVKETPSKHRPIRRKLVQVNGTTEKAYAQAKTTLRRCFCTFKLQANKSKKKTKTSKTGTEMLSRKTSQAVRSMTDKYVETKNNKDYKTPKLYQLLPYQCEPGVCIPGECNPILCKKILDLRNKRRTRKSIGSNTGSHKTRSTTSIISRHFKSPRAKLVQSSIASTKTGKTTPYRRYKDNLNLGRGDLIKTSINTPERQGVCFGSSFSFNIEFYKDIQKPDGIVPDKVNLSALPPEFNQKRQKFKDHYRNKSMFTQVIDMGKSKGTSHRRSLCTLKSCRNKGSIKKLKNTQTLKEASIMEWVDRGTETKKKYRYKLLPFQCEPYFCVPGDCDPYICLQKIKRRDMHTRNISTFTKMPKMRSISSFMEKVHPKQYQKGTGMNVDYFKPEETVKPSKAKQAVRIGSNFNFSMEFSKQQPAPVTLSKPRKKKQFLNLDSKMNNGKGITITKVRVSHDSTQASTHKTPKVNKASLIRPVLKRCFCTLNLQKKTKQHYRERRTSEGKYFGPNNYTIFRATNTKTNIISRTFGSHINTKFHPAAPESEVITMSTSSFLLNKHIKSLESTYDIVNHYSTLKLPIQSKRPTIIKSNLSLKVGFIRHLKDTQVLKSSCRLSLDEKFREHSHLSFIEQSDQSFKKITGISRYLERCFCTMNVKVSNQGDALKEKKISNKLKPYECEPGICIPDECDPYECKNLIMRRLAKNMQNSTGTIYTTKPVSSHATNYSEIDYRGPEKQTKRRKKLQVHEKIHKEYKPLRQYRSQPFEKYVDYNETNTQMQKPVIDLSQKPKDYNVNRKDSSTQMKEPINRKIQKTVSIGTQEKKIQRDHTNRCFCTLKLQKKGRIHSKYINKEDTNTRIKKSLSGSTYKSVSIDAHGDKTHVKNRRLQPIVTSKNEKTASTTDRCFCTLKFIKKGRVRRKYTTLNTLPLKKLSSREPLPIKETLSLKEKSHKASKTSVNQKYKNRAVNVISERKYKSTKPMKYVKSVENVNSQIAGTSSRQAVRINSNFSFSIEFFKDKPQIEKYQDVNLGRAKTPTIDSRSSKDRKEIKTIYSPTTKDRKEVKSIYPPSPKSVSRKGTETEKQFIQRPKTATSRVERSLNNIPDQRNKKTFRYKCLCLLGLRSKGHKGNQSTGKNYSQIKENRDYQPADELDAPGKINTNYKSKMNLPYLEPYECEPGICVPGQCNPYLCEKVIQQRTIKQYSIKLENEPLRTQSITTRHGRRLKRFKNERIQETPTKYNLRSSKVEPKIEKMTFKVSPLLKRCLCILKLKKKQIENKKNKTMKSVKTQSNRRLKHKLLTDLSLNGLSAVQQKSLQKHRIKKRHRHTKEYGTITEYPKKRTFSNVSKIDTMKDENLLVKPPITITKKGVQNANDVYETRPVESYNQQRQAVRIGSNFSFNIEFFRDTGYDSPKVVTALPKEEFYIQKISKNISQKHIRTQPSDIERARHFSKNKHVQPEMIKFDHSSVRNFLKKCICTLKINKVGKQQNKPSALAIKYEMKGTSTHSRRIPQVRTLHPFECEPYVCVPGECNPYECLKLIQQRRFRDYGTNYKRNVKDFGTDSIKQPLHKSTKVQYEQRRKFNSRGTSLPSKHSRPNKETNQFPSLTSPDSNRQVVRIGSNFSFNVEFFKGHVTQDTEYNDNKEYGSEELILKRPENQWEKYKGTSNQRHCNKYCQFSEPKRQVIRPSSKKMNHPKSDGKLLSSIKTKDKRTATKIKYTIPQDMGVYECPPHMCIPGQCNPYECLEKIKKREHIRKPVNNLRTHKVQSQAPKRRNVIVSTPNSEMQSEILKSSQKRKSEPAVVSIRKIKGRDNEEGVNISDNVNLPERCFCTLKLQKLKKERGKGNPGSHVKYPQTFTVGRVVVEPFLNPFTNINPSKNTDVTKSTFIHPKLLNKTIGTKVNQYYFRNSVQCNPIDCSNSQKRMFRRKAQGDMQNSLPHTSSKFNKKESLIIVPDKNKFRKNRAPNYLNEENVHRPSDISLIAKTKRRLTVTKSNKQIPTNLPDAKSNFKESFFCRCSRFFSGRFKFHDKPIQPRTTGQPVGIKILLPQKNAKTFGKDCPFICPGNNNGIDRLQSDNKFDYPSRRVTFTDISESVRNAIPKRNIGKSTLNACLLNDCPLILNNLKGAQQTSTEKNMKSNKKAVAYSESADNCHYCKSCKSKINTHEINKGGGDRRVPTLLRRQISKADHPVQKYNVKRQSPRKAPKDVNNTKEKVNAAKQSIVIKSQKAAKGANQSPREAPKIVNNIKEKVNTAKQNILIKSQKAAKGANQSPREAPKDVKNTKEKVNDAKKNILIKSQKAAEGAQRALDRFGKLFPQSRPPQPCICGSKACKKKLNKEKKHLPQEYIKFGGRTCVCGSSICGTESKRFKKKQKRKAVKRKSKPIVNQYDRKPFKERIKIAKKKDEIRRLERIQRNKELEKEVKKYKNASDLTLALDSLIDIGRLGGSSLVDALRYSTRAYTDPLVARETLCNKRKRRTCCRKSAERDDAMSSNIYSTYRRVRTRCSFMERIKLLKKKLSRHRVTHFLMHIGDKNAKSRKFKGTPEKRVRQRGDFHCNVYMATLRKKPFISVYYRYPRYYPHFLAMLSIWRQFTNIVMLVLAVVVWSPCILFVELCRALMCCFFCTG